MNPMQSVMHEVPMFVCSLFHHLVALPVNTVVKKNTIVLNVPLSHSIVLAEAHGVMQRDLVANLASGGATAHGEPNNKGKDEVNCGRYVSHIE